MLVLLECIVNVPRHGAVDMVLLIVSREFYATEEQVCPVNGNLIVFLKCHLEVIKSAISITFMPKLSTTRQKVMVRHM
jgi:hypothetical protein